MKYRSRVSTVQLPPPRISFFTITYLLCASYGAWVNRNQEFLFYLAIMVILIAAVLVVHTRVILSNGVLWGLSVWGILHMAGGLLPIPLGWSIEGESRVLYNWWLIPRYLKYDHLVHAYGFGVTTFVCWEGLTELLKSHSDPPRKPRGFGSLILCGAASLGFGALNEVVEFVATLSIPETNVGGYENTGWDLVANLVGVALASLIIHLRIAQVT
jgi:uncharacterized membrane protein YjdF